MSKGRFPPGHCGNPNGRPRKHSPYTSALSAILDQKLIVTQNGNRREVTSEEALLLRVADRALKGDRTALRTALEMIGEREVWRASHSVTPKSKSDFKIIRERDSDNAVEALCILKIASRCPRPLEPDVGLKPDLSWKEHELDDFDQIDIAKWALDAGLVRCPDLPRDDKFLEAELKGITEKSGEDGPYDRMY